MTTSAALTDKVAIGRSSHRIHRRDWLPALLFLTPQLIGLVVFLGIPLLISLFLTFTKWDLLSPTPQFIGLQNWQRLPQDPKIPQVLFNTVEFIGASTTTYLLLSLLLAVTLQQPRPGIALMRGLFFLPWVLSQIAVGAAWTFVFNQRSGPLALALQSVGVNYVSPLLDQNTAMLGVAMVATWQALGYGMTIYMAGLQGIPTELYEAVKIDGGNAWQRFRHVTLPLLSPTILFLTITGIIAAFQLFDLVVLLSSAGGAGSAGGMGGGPAGATTTIVLYLYQQMFVLSERLSGAGYAATLSWMLALIVFAITFIQWQVSRRWVFYLGS